jgi:hypothetical protein
MLSPRISQETVPPPDYQELNFDIIFLLKIKIPGVPGPPLKFMGRKYGIKIALSIFRMHINMNVRT